MRSGLAIEMRIWSKLCGPETCPKMFINSFIEDPSRTNIWPGGARLPPGDEAAGPPLLHLQIQAIYRSSVVALLQLDIEAKRAQLLDEDVERFGNARLEIVVAADDRLVDLGAAGDVVRLDGQHLLQGVGRAISFERPHLHLAETLTAELRLAAQRLLGDQAVRPDRAGVDLVVDEMMELQHIDVADRHLAIEGLAGAPVDQGHLAGAVEAGLRQHTDDVLLACAVEHRTRHRHTVAELAREHAELGVIHSLELGALLHLFVDRTEQLAQLDRLRGPVILRQHLADLAAETGCRPAEMRLEDLPDIHAARHAERIEHDVDRRAVIEIRHVLDRHDLRDDALVAMPSGHLVAGLQLALHRDEDLDHLHDARRQLVAALELFDLALETRLQGADGIIHLLLQRLDIGHPLVVAQRDALPLAGRVFGEQSLGHLDTRLQTLGAARHHVVEQQFLESCVEAALEDRALVVAVLGETLDLGPLDGESTLVLVDTAPREDAHFDNRARHAGRQAQRRVAHVRRLLAEDGAEQLLFRGHRRFALRRHLADQDVAWLDLCPDIDDAGLVEVLQRFFADIRDVASDFLLAELGVASHHLEFLDMDRGENVVGNDALGDEDRILEVVAVPRHEGDEHIAAERELAELRRGPVADDIAGLDDLPDIDQRPLRDAGVLVRPLELQKVVDVDAGRRRRGLLGGADDDAGGIDLVDDAGPAGDDGDAAVAGHRLFHAGADERRLGLDERHRLTLHV